MDLSPASWQERGTEKDGKEKKEGRKGTGRDFDGSRMEKRKVGAYEVKLGDLRGQVLRTAAASLPSEATF